MKKFEQINKAYNRVFVPDQLSIGIIVPIENYAKSAIPSMKDHLQRVHYVEQLGFNALWVRDVPFHVPSFGDAGQTYDPFTYLGYLAGKTNTIALGVASIALPLHHPLHVAKSAATIDQLSEGRLLLGVASGDRYEEYPAMGFSHEKREARFREAFQYIRASQDSFPKLPQGHFGKLPGHIDVLPKANGSKIPMLITGFSQQSLTWNAENADGWIYYPRELTQQKARIDEWRHLIPNAQEQSKPFMQSLYIDLHSDNDFKPQPIHLGFRIGLHYFIEYLKQLEVIGVNHVALNLRLNQRSIERTLEIIADKVLPYFKGGTTIQ